MMLLPLLELLALYVLPPIAFKLFDAPRLVIFLFLWTACAAILLILRRQGDAWRMLWEGRGWSRARMVFAVRRFAILGVILAGLILLFEPDRLLSFPLQRPALWSAVIILYPFLSALPQSLFFRVFFFVRYEKLFESKAFLILINGVCFGLAHSLYGNMIAPIASAIAGTLLAQSFLEHRSLKWAAVEHAAYGCLVFTLGIGTYFFKHG